MKNTVGFLLTVLFCACSSYAGLNDGLMAYYPFDGNANDSSGNNNNGFVYGATLTYGHDGTPNSAYYFNGVNNYIQIPPSPSLDIRGSVSLCAWVKNNSDDDGIIIWRGDTQSGTDPYQLHIAGWQMEFRLNRGNGLLGYYIPSIDTVDNAWHFWVGIFDETTSKSYLYKDKVLQNVLNTTQPIQYDTSQMWNMIGAVDYGTWQFFCGSIDEVRIYNRALTYDEVTQLQNTPCPAADLNGDCIVNFADFTVLTSQWLTGTGSPQNCPSADLTGDCFINLSDFAILASQWLDTASSF